MVWEDRSDPVPIEEAEEFAGEDMEEEKAKALAHSQRWYRRAAEKMRTLSDEDRIIVNEATTLIIEGNGAADMMLEFFDHSGALRPRAGEQGKQ